jgi:aminopeptidase N
MTGFSSFCLRVFLFAVFFLPGPGAGILLAQEYDVKYYGLDVEVDNSSDYIKGEATILAEVVNQPLNVLVLDLYEGLEVEQVEVNGTGAGFSHEEEQLRVTLDKSAEAGSLLSIKVRYSGKTGGGMVREIDREWNVPVTYTSTEPFYAKDWFPCKQDLEDKADSVHIYITTPFHLKGVSQGLLTATTYFPNGKVRYEWKSHHPVAYYLISIAVADYVEYDLEAHPVGLSSPIFIQNFLYDTPGCLETYREDINVTVPIMELYCERFGTYPFADEKYGHYLWPWGGGMEHQTMTGVGNFDFYLVAHELGHSWFGNYVTCQTWQDIWINEGFATFAGYMATEVLEPEYAAGERDYRFNSALEQPDGSVYIPAAQAQNDARIFSGSLSYNKGMALIYMIRYELQDDGLFYRILREFLARHANGTATGLDFKAVLEELSGQDFTDFFNQWYFGAGYPIYGASWEQEGSQVTLHVTQRGSSDRTPLFRMSMEYRLSWVGGDTTVRVIHDQAEESYVFEVPGEVTQVEIDPYNHVLNRVEGAVKKESALHVEVYPNPVKDHFSYIVEGEQLTDIRLDLYSFSGQLVHSSFHEGVMPGQPHDIYTGTLEAGIYFLRITYGPYTETKKIIVK